MQAIGRMFTPSDSDNQSGEEYNRQYNQMAMPEAPKQETAQETAEKTATAKRKAIARSRTIYTSPLGIGGEASVIKKTLLGR